MIVKIYRIDSMKNDTEIQREIGLICEDGWRIVGVTPSLVYFEKLEAVTESDQATKKPRQKKVDTPKF